MTMSTTALVCLYQSDDLLSRLLIVRQYEHTHILDRFESTNYT